MMTSTYASQFIERAVEQLAKFPGVGKKTALRMALYLLKQEPAHAQALSQALVDLAEKVKYCAHCHAFADEAVCAICSAPGRDRTMLCVVAEVHDVLAIENTACYRGLYHVIGGILDPVHEITPKQLNMASLFDRVAAGSSEFREVILALNATLEGDAMAHYLIKKLAHYPVKVSTIARGIPVGGELEYTDEITLKRSLQERVPYASRTTPQNPPAPVP